MRAELLADFPSEWLSVPLGSLATYVNGYGFNSESWGSEGRPIIRIQNLTGTSDKFNYFDGPLDNRYAVELGDILVSWSASLGVFTWSGPEAWLNQHIFRVTDLSDGVDREFLYYALLLQIESIKERTHGSIMKHVTRRDFLATEIPLPPLGEQRTVAQVLRTFQRAKEATEQVIAAARQLKKSLVLHHLKGDWPARPLGDVSTIGNGSTPNRSRTEYWTGGTIPWITSRKVHESVIHRAEDFVTELAVRECHLPRVPAGSVVVAISGQGKTLGNAALVTFDTTVNQHLAYVRPHRRELDPEFLVGYLSSRYKELQAIGRAGGSTRAALTCALLRSYPIPLPPLVEQQAIAHSITVLDRKIEAEEARRDALATLFDSLLHDLMTARLRVTDQRVPV
jgi:type I restriction enzyme S subunit